MYIYIYSFGSLFLENSLIRYASFQDTITRNEVCLFVKLILRFWFFPATDCYAKEFSVNSLSSKMQIHMAFDANGYKALLGKPKS